MHCPGQTNTYILPCMGMALQPLLLTVTTENYLKGKCIGTFPNAEEECRNPRQKVLSLQPEYCGNTGA